MQVSMKDSAGKQRKMSEWQGKVLVLNFWATWCPPCVSEMPELVALQNEWQNICSSLTDPTLICSARVSPRCTVRPHLPR
ncbi:MAG: TlpA family protein disulfide reductase [Oxalobacteraceae bacterium]|nr:TlpA family protein disulfide reductase [Oxalobacteraceae bacterium]